MILWRGWRRPAAAAAAISCYLCRLGAGGSRRDCSCGRVPLTLPPLALLSSSGMWGWPAPAARQAVGGLCWSYTPHCHWVQAHPRLPTQ